MIEFFKVEVSRNFEAISQFYTYPVETYWNESYLSKKELRKSYGAAWSRNIKSNNLITFIMAYGSGSEYHVTTKFTYKRKGETEEKTTLNNLTMKFNEEGKIRSIK